jgi:hypothetical protein
MSIPRAERQSHGADCDEGRGCDVRHGDVLAGPAAPIRIESCALASALTQRLGDHRCSLPVASRIEQDLHGRQGQHGDPSATDDDSVYMVQVRSGDYHVTRWAYSLYAFQDLDLDAVDHGEGPAGGAHVAAIPAGLVAQHGAPQPIDQLGRG